MGRRPAALRPRPPESCRLRTGRLPALAVAALVTLAWSGCGYRDDNRQAARVVAQGFLDGYAEQDAGAVCRVLGPGQLALLAGVGGGDCRAGVRASFRPREASLRAGAVRGNDADVMVVVEGEGQSSIRLLKLGSIWRVVDSPRITEAAS